MKKKMPILKVENFGSAGWIASLKDIPGMLAQADTKEKAIEELMISIKVKLLYDYGKL